MTEKGTISARINEIIESMYGGNKSSFARAVGISESSVRSYLGGTMPKADVMEKIVESIAISCEWLLTGNGSMRRHEPPEILGSSEKETAEQGARFDKMLDIIDRQAAQIERLEAHNKELVDENARLRVELKGATESGKSPQEQRRTGPGTAPRL